MNPVRFALLKASPFVTPVCETQQVQMSAASRILFFTTCQVRLLDFLMPWCHPPSSSFFLLLPPLPPRSSSRQTSLATSWVQWDSPDIICHITCQLVIAVGLAGLHLPPPWTAPASSWSPERMPDRMPERMSERMPNRMSDEMPDQMSEIECQVECQKECQIDCQIKCQR